MKTMKLLALVCLMVFTQQGFAQKMNWVSGEDLAFLKGEKTILVEYDFSNMIVGETTEAEFLEAKSKEINEDKPGKGEEFVKHWHEAKETKYPKQFEENFNNELKKEDLKARKNAESKYTILVVTNNIKTGKGSAWRNKPAEIDFTISIVETANKSNVLAKATMENVKGLVQAPKGSGFIPGDAGRVVRGAAYMSNFEVTNRIAESYQQVAEALAKQIRKKM